MTNESTTPDPSAIDMSKMSEGKREALQLAEASREAQWQHESFAAALFMGRFPWRLISPYPKQSEEDAAASAAFLKNIEKLLREEADPDQIDADGEIPQALIDRLAALGSFGIKISKEYGGLGLSQLNYSRTAILLGSYCGNLTALLSAHQSIGVPQPLKLFGTPEQKEKYLPRVASGEISAFALTETAVGSDPAMMETRAEPSEDGSHFVINGEKLWCTNGTCASLYVVMARTPDKEVHGKPRRQITAFIVEADAPGVTIERRCHFMGLRALYNGVIRFKDVKVPKENIILAEGKGLKVALTTLNTGRLTLPAACVGLAKKCLDVTRQWAAERVQWGAPIGKHAAIADKIAMMASELFAAEAMTLLTAALVDRGDADIRLEAAMCKMFGSEVAWRIVDETMQVRGGRGYETAASLKARGEDPIAVERFMRDCRINMIFEGSSEIMRLFIAREALDPHLKEAGAAMNPKLSMGERLSAALKASAFYAGWYPSKWWPFAGVSTSGLDRTLARHVAYAARTSRKLARRFFHSMARYGPRLEREQMLLGRYVDIGTDLFAIAASCARAQSLIEEGRAREEVLSVADHFCRRARARIERRFKEACCNQDKGGYKLARQVLEGGLDWLEEGIVGNAKS